MKSSFQFKFPEIMFKINHYFELMFINITNFEKLCHGLKENVM